VIVVHNRFDETMVPMLSPLTNQDGPSDMRWLLAEIRRGAGSESYGRRAALVAYDVRGRWGPEERLQPVGWAAVYFRDECYHLDVFVDPLYRGKGIARLLLENAEDKAIRMGARSLYLAHRDVYKKIWPDVHEVTLSAGSQVKAYRKKLRV
jgi:GNAT superfamily N-acetyltransferase